MLALPAQEVGFPLFAGDLLLLYIKSMPTDINLKSSAYVIDHQTLTEVASPAPNRDVAETTKPSSGPASDTPAAFCHMFDLTKRLTLPSASSINFISIPLRDPQSSPFANILETLMSRLSTSPQNQIHRLVIPTLLSPALYPAHASQPHHLSSFLHALRALLRRYPTQLTAMMTLPLELYPRSMSLVRWCELLSDGVVELTPFPHSQGPVSSIAASGAATAQEERPQGMVKIHRLPVFHERGGGVLGARGVWDDLAFAVSRRKFIIKPFSLPPVEGDTEAQQGGAPGEGEQQKVSLEF